MNDSLMLERGRVRAHFDRAAAGYDAAASLQRRAAERLLHRVDALGLRPQAILDAGCGTGYGARALDAQFGTATLCCLDLASAMLARARADFATPAYVCADAEKLPLAAGSFDLVWSNLMLQWCNDLPRVFAAFAHVLRPDGTLACATFGPHTLMELRAAFKDSHTHVSRFPATDELDTALRATGFADIDIERRSTVLHYPELGELMRALKSLGARNATSGRARGLTGKGRWRAMAERYEAARAEQGLPATYELIYFTARRPA